MTSGLRAQLKHIAETHNQLMESGQQNGMSGWSLRYMAVGGVLADLVGLRSIAGAIGGGDPYTLQKWSKWECVANGIGGTITLVTSALGISRALGALTGSCSGWLGGNCFVGETLVATNWEPAPPAIVSAGTTDIDNSAIGWLLNRIPFMRSATRASNGSV